MPPTVSNDLVRQGLTVFLAALFLALTCVSVPAAERGSPWYRSGPGGERQVVLYFFWSRTCPHCLEAKPEVEALAAARPWLVLDAREVSRSAPNRIFFSELAQWTGQEIRGVPTFFLCGHMEVGFGAEAGGVQKLLKLAERCRSGQVPEASGASGARRGTPAQRAVVPFLGTIDVTRLSLPVLTIVLGGLDAFNPCAFFVLLTLLSLMIHANSRMRMAVIGGVFVFFSGAVYFLFMAAWLNLFALLQGVQAVTLVAGLVAVVIGALNVKDYFAFRRGPSLSIPERAKPGLFGRMRKLLAARNMGAMVAGTVVLALAANAYELLCTSGFPMIYTRVLTLNEPSAAARYLYLGLYNLVYVLPLLIIVVLFTATLGARKLSEAQGRILKLVSGLMMLGLGLLILFAPSVLTNLFAAIGLLAAAVLLTVLAESVRRWRGAT